MKIYSILIALGCAAVLFPALASAHNADQLPFVKVNGEEARVYTVGATSLPDIVMPQDKTLTNYLVKTPIAFELIPINLPFSQSTIPKIHFLWDFGDGTSSTDANPTKTYTEARSYLVTLTSTVPDEGIDTPQTLDILLINVVPNAGYKLPVATLHVNGRGIVDPYKDIVTMDFKTPVSYDASVSQPGTGKIVEYLWDFGDGTRATTAKAEHSYSTQWSYVAVMLRVKDENGFINDTLAQVQNPDPVVTLSPSPTPAAKPSSLPKIGVIAGVAGIVVAFALAAAIRMTFEKKKAGPKKKKR